MKNIKITTFLAAAVVFSLSACEKKIDEKTAIANFKAEVERVAKSVNAESEATSEADSLAQMSEGIKKFQSIKSDDLPADLKTAWTEMIAVMNEMSVAMSEMNATVDIVNENMTGDKSQLGAALSAKTNKLMNDVSIAGKKLQDEGMKYGLDMQKIMNGK